MAKQKKRKLTFFSCLPKTNNIFLHQKIEHELISGNQTKILSREGVTNENVILFPK